MEGSALQAGQRPANPPGPGEHPEESELSQGSLEDRLRDTLAVVSQLRSKISDLEQEVNLFIYRSMDSPRDSEITDFDQIRKDLLWAEKAAKNLPQDSSKTLVASILEETSRQELKVSELDEKTDTLPHSPDMLRLFVDHEVDELQAKFVEINIVVDNRFQPSVEYLANLAQGKAARLESRVSSLQQAIGSLPRKFTDAQRKFVTMRMLYLSRARDKLMARLIDLGARRDDEERKGGEEGFETSRFGQP